jgi:hypothetical protein
MDGVGVILRRGELDGCSGWHGKLRTSRKQLDSRQVARNVVMCREVVGNAPHMAIHLATSCELYASYMAQNHRHRADLSCGMLHISCKAMQRLLSLIGGLSEHWRGIAARQRGTLICSGSR